MTVFIELNIDVLINVCQQIKKGFHLYVTHCTVYVHIKCFEDNKVFEGIEGVIYIIINVLGNTWVAHTSFNTFFIHFNYS